MEKDFHLINDIDQVYFISPEIELEEERTEKMRSFSRLHELLDVLPEKYRTVLVLRYFEGLTYEEVAQVLRKRIGTVKSLVHRGLKCLRHLLDD